MVAIRDLKCSMDIAEMAALGKFEEEFIIYGCCYMDQDETYYKISNKIDDIYRFIEQCVDENIYPSTMQQLLNRTLVPSGKQDEYLYRSKLMLAKQMQKDFSGDIIKLFAILAREEGNDSAEPLLRQIKQQLNGCFDRNLLQLVEGIIYYAYCQKKLTPQTYRSFKQWLQYLYRQMEDDVVIKKSVQRTFYGFAYRNEQQKVRYYANAQRSDVMQQRERLLCKGILGSPIVQKTYYFDYQPNLAETKAEFVTWMGKWMDQEYWDILHTIDKQPSSVDRTALEQLVSQAEDENNTALSNYLQYYQGLWFPQ